MGSSSELDAAGITDPGLRAAFADCRRLNARHGRTYFVATRLLPTWKRPYVHALYGLARYADEVVDEVKSPRSVADRAAELDRLENDLAAPCPALPVARAMAHTVRRWAIPPEYLSAFLASMRMDLCTAAYRTYDDLARYMHGSAAVIGLEMVPVLGHPGLPRSVVEPYAADLGVAFQLTNFIRDIGEDLRRGRLYLPMADLEEFRVDRDRLERGVVDGPVRRLIAFEIARTRELYRSAAAGVRLVDPTSQDCLRTAIALYGSILDQVEAADYQVLDRRVSVGTLHRLRVVSVAVARATAAQRRVRSLPTGVPAA